MRLTATGSLGVSDAPFWVISWHLANDVCATISSASPLIIAVKNILYAMTMRRHLGFCQRVLFFAPR